MAIYLGNQEVGFSNIAPLKPIILRPDAELVQTYSNDSLIAADDEIEIPTYNTTATPLIEAAELSPVIQLDVDNYNYFVVQRLLTIPIYNVTTVGKGRQEYSFTIGLHEIPDFYPHLFQARQGTANVAAGLYAATGTTLYRCVYYSSTTTVTYYTATTYGIHQTIQTPVADSSTLTLKSPSMSVRGHGTYFSSTYYNAMTDCRRQYIIQVYRVRKRPNEVEGWGFHQAALSIANAVNGNGTLV